MGCGALLTYDAKTALKYALEPYPALSIVMVQPLVNKCTITDMNEILKHTGIQCGFCHPCNRSSYAEYSKFNNSHSVPKGHNSAEKSQQFNDNRGKNNSSINSVVCRCCDGKGHYASQCPSGAQQKPGVQYLQDYEGNIYNSNSQDIEALGKGQAE